ncbi:MAG: hypothetical protein K0R92_1147 [Lachnospiraceae bacterium]|jgi:hypothetical protein|nr:hypothetical protein [Lachnospiraceae bacterium]
MTPSVPFAERWTITMNKIRIIALMAFAISLIIFMDLTNNYFNATFTELHDGIIMSGVFGRLIYGDSNWTLSIFSMNL